MKVEEMKALIEKYLEAYNSFDIESMMPVIHPDIEFVNIADGEVNAAASGADSFRQLAEDSSKLFTERRQTVTNLKFEKNKVSVEISYEAVLAADMPNGMKAGEKINIMGHSDFTFRDGKILKIADRS